MITCLSRIREGKNTPHSVIHYEDTSTGNVFHRAIIEHSPEGKDCIGIVDMFSLGLCTTIFLLNSARKSLEKLTLFEEKSWYCNCSFIDYATMQEFMYYLKFGKRILMGCFINVQDLLLQTLVHLSSPREFSGTTPKHKILLVHKHLQETVTKEILERKMVSN